MGGDLAAELGADGSAAAGDQHHPIVDLVKDLPHIRLDRLPAQEILHGDILHIADGDIAVHQLIHARKLLDLAVRFITDGQDIPLLLGGGAGNGEENLIHTIFLHRAEDFLPPADDGHPIEVPLPFVRIIIDNADHRIMDLPGLIDIPEDQLARGAGADQHDPLRVRADFAAGAEELDKAEAEAGHRQEDELEAGPQNIIRKGHAAEADRDQGRMEQGDHEGDAEDPQEIRRAGKAPHAVIHAKKIKDDDGAEGIGKNKTLIRPQKLRGNLAEDAVKTEPEGEKIRRADGQEIIEGQENRHNLPMLQPFSASAGTAVLRAAVLRAHDAIPLSFPLKISGRLFFPSGKAPPPGRSAAVRRPPRSAETFLLRFLLCSAAPRSGKPTENGSPPA